MSLAIKGTIKGFQGTSPGPDSGITWTIEYREGESVISTSGNATSLWRWPDTIDIDAQRMVGAAVYGLRTEEGKIAWFFIAPPFVGPCQGGSGGWSGGILAGGGGLVRQQTPPGGLGPPSSPIPGSGEQ